ncbi:hypothetical protein PT974_01913 [Cladobotryum mycophilum]|uniref:Uncharacterized protein n=1 Tax=Cladobotryum mycophilum TaxID=491253 RepID=A0ABR0SXW3_9HYPO
MKFHRGIGYALLASHISLAMQIADGKTDLAQYQSVDPQHAVLLALDDRNVLERRVSGGLVNRLARAVGDDKLS